MNLPTDPKAWGHATMMGGLWHDCYECSARVFNGYVWFDDNVPITLCDRCYSNLIEKDEAKE